MRDSLVPFLYSHIFFGILWIFPPNFHQNMFTWFIAAAFPFFQELLSFRLYPDVNNNLL